MKLFLSSYEFGDHVDRLLDMVETKRVLFVENAKDYLAASDRAAHITEKRRVFRGLGFDFEELDLRSHFHAEHDFSQQLEGVGLVWLAGGNTFMLRRALKQSGFDNILSQAVLEGRVVYGGSSAGAIVATPSLEGAELADDPHDTPAGYNEAVVWGGLGLVKFHVVPHYESTYADEVKIGADKMITALKRQKAKYFALRDSEAYIVNGHHQEHLK